ncbi:methylenetetrahydrofolate reductase [soil metagenome]
MTNDVNAVPDIASTVTSLASHFSLEVTPKEVRKHPGLLREALPANTLVYTTFLANTPFEDTVAAAASVVQQGLHPVPHLAARSVADEAELDRMVGRLAEVGVAELLVIAGSVTRPRGVYSESMQVLRSGVLERHGIRRVGVAGHPEGNADIGVSGLAKALQEKNEFARDTGCDVYLLTQFCFAAEPIIQWEQSIRALGNNLPIHVGLPGLSSPVMLLKFGAACGVGASLKVLRKQSGGVLKLATKPVYYPDQTLVGLARAVVSDPNSRIAGIHFFPFGAVAATADWAARIGDGHFQLDDRRDRVSLFEVTA